MRHFIISLIFALLSMGVYAALPPDLDKDMRFFIQKSPSVNGLRVEVELLEPNIRIPSCQGGSISLNTAPGARVWGRTLVQARCSKFNWMVNIPVHVHVFGDYVVASRYLPLGQKVTFGDFRVTEGDLSLLPDDVLRNPKVGYERVLSKSLQMGSPVGLNDLRESAVIKIGDPVRLLLSGKDFEVSGEGVAQTAGVVGDMVRVRLADGQVLQGKVLRLGVVVVNVE